MSTENQIGISLTGYSGSGSFVGTKSPTLITPSLGDSTATSLTFSPSTNGIVGSSDGSSASALYVGELITNNASGVAINDVTATDICSINLTSGDWDVYGNVSFSGSSIDVLTMNGWISTTSATLPATDYSGPSYGLGGALFGLTLNPGFAIPMQRISINTNTTVYLSCEVNYTPGNCNAAGTIFARRRR